MNLPAPSECPAIRVMMMPRDTNANGTIFGGVILSFIDQAGAIEARRHAAHKFVTVAMDKIEFKKPVYVGDVLSFYSTVTRVGRTSITMHVSVTAQRFNNPREVVPVTEANLIYVSVDDHGTPVPLEMNPA